MRALLVRCVVAALAVSPGTLQQSRAHAQEGTADFDALFAAAQQAYSQEQWDAAASTYQSIRDRARQQGDEVCRRTERT